jgi:hypothetical protein
MMMMKASFVVAVPLALALGLVAAVASIGSAQNDPRVGSWKLNLAKSKYDPGPASKSDMRTYEADGDGVKATVKIVSATGDATTRTYSAKYDGKDYPETGNPAVDTIALKRINASTQEATLKKKGRVVQTARTVFSKDGKVMTLTINGTNASGQPVKDVMVFDKQEDRMNRR